MKNNIQNVVKPFLVKYKPELLISIGISGFIASNFLTASGTIKAVRLVDAEKNKRKVDKLSKKDTVKLCWKCYLPSVVTVGASIPCIMLGNNVNNKRNAALAAAYTVAETSLQSFKEETTKLIGEEKTKEVEHNVNQKQVEKTYNKALVIEGDADSIFLDPISGRYFKSTWNKLQLAANNLNASAIGGGNEISLADWYDEIGLDRTAGSDEVGWTVFDGTKGLITISMDSCITTDNRPCGVICYDTMPKRLY